MKTTNKNLFIHKVLILISQHRNHTLSWNENYFEEEVYHHSKKIYFQGQILVFILFCGSLQNFFYKNTY